MRFFKCPVTHRMFAIEAVYILDRDDIICNPFDDGNRLYVGNDSPID
jgi:hypothetical protein